MPNGLILFVSTILPETINISLGWHGHEKAIYVNLAGVLSSISRFLLPNRRLFYCIEESLIIVDLYSHGLYKGTLICYLGEETYQNTSYFANNMLGYLDFI